ncbi:MAG: CBS domain-containing protein [Nitrospirae bacterium]|nr:CBS domain-containing protein [Nitrospirota bacterium]MCZ6780788.1 CBS domain-containing protein [Nitrospirota bacterium]
MATLVQVMRRELKTIAHHVPIREVAKRMRDERVGALFVEQNGELVGIVTETDVVRRAVAEDLDLGSLRAQSIMTVPIVTIESIRTVQDAHDMMGDLGVRHLGVTEQGKLVGVVSVRDLLVYFKRVSEPKITQD